MHIYTITRTRSVKNHTNARALSHTQDALDAQDQREAAESLLIASAAASTDPTEYLGLLLRFAGKGDSWRARACFHAAVSRGRHAAGRAAVAHVHDLQRRVWAQVSLSLSLSLCVCMCMMRCVCLC